MTGGRQAGINKPSAHATKYAQVLKAVNGQRPTLSSAVMKSPTFGLAFRIPQRIPLKGSPAGLANRKANQGPERLEFRHECNSGLARAPNSRGMVGAHRPGTANTSGDEVPLQQEIDPFTAIIVNDQVKPIQRKRPKLSETENVSNRCAIE